MPTPFQADLAHTAMDDPGAHRDLLRNLPRDVPSLVKWVQNALVHQHMAGWVYGLELDQTRVQEPWQRRVEEKLAWLKQHGFTSLGEVRPIGEHMVGICRDFSVLAVCLFREAGIAARARCGFATYFEPGKSIDHWVVEWWNADTHSWTLTDAQLDAAQLDKLGHPITPLDVPRDRFLTGPVAWRWARDGRADPQSFGIMKWWGYDYLAWNLLLDAHSLLGDPFQPWDRWGPYAQRLSPTWEARDFAVFDALAAATEDGRTALCDFFAPFPSLRVPSDWSQVVNTLAL